MFLAPISLANVPVINVSKFNPPPSFYVSSRHFPAVPPYYCQPPGDGAFSRDCTEKLNPKCRAFSKVYKIEKLKALLIDWYMYNL